MKAFITGAAGFIGSRIARRMVAAGADVVGLDAFTGYYDPATKRANVAGLQRMGRFRLIEADLASTGWEAALENVEVVFHSAAQPGVRASWDQGFADYLAHNVQATQRLLELLRASPPGGLRRIVYASSSSVYGDALTFPTSEETLPQPMSPYGVTKLAAEQLCGVYARNWGLPVVSLRYFTVYGAGQRPDMATYRLIAAALGGTPFPRFGDGRQLRDFTHVDDVIDANLAAVEADLQPGEVINIAGGSELSLQGLIDLVGEQVGCTVPIEARPAQAGDVVRTGGDTTRARRLLGWQPRVTLTDGLAEQIAWQRRRAAGSVAAPAGADTPDR